jgi:hypothetical protein
MTLWQMRRRSMRRGIAKPVPAITQLRNYAIPQFDRAIPQLIRREDVEGKI